MGNEVPYRLVLSRIRARGTLITTNDPFDGESSLVQDIHVEVAGIHKKSLCFNQAILAGFTYGGSIASGHTRPRNPLDKELPMAQVDSRLISQYLNVNAANVSDALDRCPGH